MINSHFYYLNFVIVQDRFCLIYFYSTTRVIVEKHVCIRFVAPLGKEKAVRISFVFLVT